MHVHEALVARRSIYKFADKQVSDEIIERAIDCARFAPCHKLTEPWRFLILGEETRRALLPAVNRLAEEKCLKKGQSNVAEQLERARKKIVDVPLLMAVTSALSEGDAFRTKEDYAATTCALHQAVLSFWADGVGAQWSTGGITRDAEAYSVLNLDASKVEIIGFLKVGYPQKVAQTSRLSVDDILKRLP